MEGMDFIVALSSVLPSVALGSILFVCVINIFLRIRRSLSFKVNCWFCNDWTVVKYDQKNSFECPSCKQYNGFTKDGDYNKVITEQYEFNPDDSNSTKTDLSNGNGLCCVCNEYQSLRVQQLANFVPRNEKKYEEELEKFKKELDCLYKLCSSCEKVVKRTIQNQNKWLLGLKFLRLRQKPSSNGPSVKFNEETSIFQILLDILIVSLSFFMLVTFLSKHSIVNLTEVFKDTLPYNYLKDVLNKLSLASSLTLVYEEIQRQLYKLCSYTTEIFGLHLYNQSDSTGITVSYYKPPINERIDYTLLSILGLTLQIFSSSFKFEQKKSLFKLMPWIILIVASLDKILMSQKVIKSIIEVTSCLLILYLTVSTGNVQKKSSYSSKKHTFKRIDVKPDDSLDNSLTDNDTLNVSSSTKMSIPASNKSIFNESFKSTASKAASVKSFVSNKTSFKSPNDTLKPTFEALAQKYQHENLFRNMGSKSPTFGEQPIFTNTLCTSPNAHNAYRLFNDQSFVKPSLMNNRYSPPASLNYSFKSAELCNNDVFSNFGDCEFDGDLPNTFSKLAVGVNKKPMHFTPVNKAPVLSFGVYNCPKPLLKPSQLELSKQWGSMNLHGSNLSIASSQTSGFVSDIFNGNCSSLPPSRNGSPHKEFDRSSLLSEPAYHMNNFMTTAPSLNTSFRSFSPI